MTSLEGVRIRPMRAADLDAVLALEQGSDAAPHWSRAQYALCIEESADFALRRFALVAQSGDLFAGFAVLRVLAGEGGGEAELESIAVTPALRGRGMGSLLLEAVVELARAEGASRLDLEVRESNQGAIRLYARAGFAESGRRRAYYSAPIEDAVLMRASL